MGSMSDNNRELFRILREFGNKAIDEWFNNSLFTWQWWLGVVISIVPWIIWLFVRDKKNTGNLIFIALFAMIVSFIVNTIGVSFGFWFYEYEIFPVVHVYFPWDYTLIPVSVMILLQIKQNKYLWVKLLFYASFSAFIAEPVFHELDHFHPINWRYAYSFVLYVGLFLACYFIYKKKTAEQNTI